MHDEAVACSRIRSSVQLGALLHCHVPRFTFNTRIRVSVRRCYNSLIVEQFSTSKQKSFELFRNICVHVVGFF